MSLWKKLFGGQPIEQTKMLPGIVVSMPAGEVKAGDVRSAIAYLEQVVILTKKHRTLCLIELTFDGFDADPRPIDQIPEIVAWSKAVHAQCPEFLTWLTPGALLRHLMCVVPGFCRRLPNGSVELSLENEEVKLAIVSGGMLAHTRLSVAGVPSDQIIQCAMKAAQYAGDALQGRADFGKHYLVALPKM